MEHRADRECKDSAWEWQPRSWTEMSSYVTLSECGDSNAHRPSLDAERAL